MELSTETVLALSERAHGFATKWSGDKADAHAAEKVRELRQRFTQDGLDLTPAEAIGKVEDAARREWDQTIATDGLDLELQLEAAKGDHERSDRREMGTATNRGGARVAAGTPV